MKEFTVKQKWILFWINLVFWLVVLIVFEVGYMP